MKLHEVNNIILPCVYKIYYGQKYLIIKGKSLAGSIHLLIGNGYKQYVNSLKKQSSSVHKRLNKHVEWLGVNTYYIQFYKWVNSTQNSFEIDIIIEDENGYNLLKQEQLALDACLSDKNCLNNNITSYIPKFRRETNSYGWLSKKDVASFRRFLSKR